MSPRRQSNYKLHKLVRICHIKEGRRKTRTRRRRRRRLDPDLPEPYYRYKVLDPHNRAAALPVATLFPSKKLLTNVVATAAASKTLNKTSKAKPNFPTRGRKKVRSGQAGPKIICVLDECSHYLGPKRHMFSQRKRDMEKQIREEGWSV